MPNYISKLLHKLCRPTPPKLQHSPCQHISIKFGQKQQLVNIEPELPRLSNDHIKYIQSVVGVLLFYAWADDSTLLAALLTLAWKQTKATATIMAEIDHILDYVATYPDACVMYKYSDMQLVCHSDASYLSVSNARSRAGGHFFLSLPPDYTK